MNKIAHRITTGLFSIMILGGVGMYLTQTETVAGAFSALGYPTYLVYPVAAAKALGIIALWVPGLPKLRELAYAGFFYELSLAILAHVMVADGEFIGATVALILLISSYLSLRSLSAQEDVAHTLSPAQA